MMLFLGIFSFLILFAFFQPIDISPNTEPVVNTEPSISITYPAQNSFFQDNESISFQANANDTEDGNLSSKVTWTSSVDGVISSTSSLSEGSHTITASVTDSGGLTTKTHIEVVVESPFVNSEPSLTITSPTAESFEEGYVFLFQASSIDTEDGDLSDSVSWSSSLDGELADMTTLSVGDHTIIASVTDSHGATAQESIFVSVTAAVVNDYPIEITWVAPSERADGSSLSINEVAGYEITLVAAGTGDIYVIDVPDGLATSHTTDPLAPDEYSLTIKTYDTNGTYSESSATVVVIDETT